MLETESGSVTEEREDVSLSEKPTCVSDGEERVEGQGMWGEGVSGRGETAARLVLARLCGETLCVAARVCRLWARLVREPHVWAHLLRARVHSHTIQAFLAFKDEEVGGSWWRQEYRRTASRWRMRARHPASDTIAHIALSQRGDRLAVAAQDATLSIWESSASSASCWSPRCNASLSPRGWAAAARVSWAPDDERLLLAGPLALTHRWELAIFTMHEEYGLVLQSRAGTSAGAAGCWAGPDAFLSFELRRLAPWQALTCVALNSASQETQSEYAGVTSPLLRIYNEAAAHITHALVADVPLEQNMLWDVGLHEDKADGAPLPPKYSYFQATLLEADEPFRPCATMRVLICACGYPGESRGEARAVSVWALSAGHAPPPLLATASLQDRVASRRARPTPLPPPPPLDEPEPAEQAVRAMCTPPDATRSLGARVLGITLHFSGRCIWVCTTGGDMTCVSLPSLHILCRVVASAGGTVPPGTTFRPYYFQPAANDNYLASRCSSESGKVCVWSSISCGGVSELPHGAPPVALAVLPLRTGLPHKSLSHDSSAASHSCLLVAAGDSIYVWSSHMEN